MIVEKAKSEATVKVKIGSESAREGKEKEKGGMCMMIAGLQSHMYGVIRI